MVAVAALGTADFLAVRATAISLKLEARQPIRGGAAGGNRSSVERNDHFIGPNQPQILAHELVRHVGVGSARVEQRRMMAQLRLLLFELRKFGLPLLERAMISAPGEDSVGSRDRMTREGADD